MKHLRVLLRKELLDLLRDRRMLFMMFGLPVVTYPALVLVLGLVTVFGQSRLKNAELTVGLVGDEARAFEQRMKPPTHTRFELMTEADAKTRLQEKKIAAFITIPPGTAATLEGHGQAKISVSYTKRFDQSNEAYTRMGPVLEQVKSDVLRVRLSDRQLDGTFIAPLIIEPIDVDFGARLGRLIASRLLPFLIIVMIVAGALTAASDSTAGEKERGTYETLLVAPVDALEVMMAKFALVSMVAVASALANVASMALTFAFGNMAAPALALDIDFSPGVVVLLLFSLSLLALVVSGFTLALMATASTMKQAQAMSGWFLTVMITPALISTVPGVELSEWNAWIPIVGVSLLIKATIVGAIQMSSAVLALVSSLVLAFAGVWTAAKVFKSERFRFSGTRSGDRALKS